MSHEPQEKPLGHGIPTLNTNRFMLYVARDVTRIVFADAIGTEDPHPHTAIVMRTSDVREMLHLFMELEAKLPTV